MDSLCSICGDSIAGGENTCLREKGVESLNKASKERGDNLVFSTGQHLQNQCRKNYTRPQTIVAVRKRKGSGEDDNREKRSLRSQEKSFDFKTKCLFCAQPDKYGGKKKGFELVPVKTMDFHYSVKQASLRRDDSWSKRVHARVLSAIDLHSADAVYHQRCSVNFRTNKEIPQCFLEKDDFSGPSKKVKVGRKEDCERLEVFDLAVQYFEQNDAEQLTIGDLVKKMREFLPAETEPYSTRHMKAKLKERFSNNLIIAEINGKADVATLRPTATKILQDFFHAPKDENSEDEKMRLVKTAAIILKNDFKSCMSNNDTYPSSADISNTDFAYLPVALRLLLEQLFVGKDNILKIASIGQAIMQAVRPRVLLPPLQLGLGV